MSSLKKYFIYRNSTIEFFFHAPDADFSGYDDISQIENEVLSYIWFYTVPIKPDPDLLAKEISFYFEKLKLVHSQIPPSKTFVVITLVDLFPFPFQNSINIVRDAIEDFNNNARQLALTFQNIKIVDISSVTNSFSVEELVDWKYYFISGTQLNPKLSGSFKKWFQLQINAIELRRKKCVVLDLDNTIWGGILGEDGIDGIKTGGDYPGNAFLLFQHFLIELSKNGIILTICSKNNEQDVLDAWEKNTNISLKKEHITAYRINWNNKADNIREIAQELNLGLESFVLIDDNPEERELIRQLLPMIEAPDFPVQPYDLPLFMKSLLQNYFQIYSLTDEDKNKLNQYKANEERSKHQVGFTDFNKYLKSLEMQITVQRATTLTTPRIAQLTQKTNQFNLTTKRYTEADITNFIGQGNCIYSLSVKDKFGDHGITGLIIVLKELDQRSVVIDSLLLSCRILGKGIEKVFINFILNKFKSDGMEEVKATYIPTAKNQQVAEFYEKSGFQVNPLNNNTLSDVKEYRMKIRDKVFEIEDTYKLEIIV